MNTIANLRLAGVLLLTSWLMACGGGSVGYQPLPAVDVSSVSEGTRTSTLSSGWRDGAFMQIFVRSYQDSNGDGVGDIRGLIDRLDYLRDMGVTGLWLMPMHPSQDRDHGYAVQDYRAIAPEYGSEQDFQELLNAAHERGIGIIMDYVLNHSAARHPAFQNASASTSNPFRDWYVWSAGMPSQWSVYGSNPWRSAGTGYYYAPFWDQMPDFNLKNQKVVDWHLDNLRYWLNMGVDGFRFDAVGNLIENGPQAWESQPENHALMHTVHDAIHRYDARFMVCEAPGAPLEFGRSDSCASAFAFGYQYDLVRAAQGDAPSLGRVAAYWRGAPEGMVGFASNHDSFAGQRLADQLGGDQARMKLAAATYLLQTRRPFIYYGEEVGMRGASGLEGDAKLRTPMSWSRRQASAGFTTGVPYRALSSNVSQANVEDQLQSSDSLLNFYRGMLKLRRDFPALQTGTYALDQVSGLAMGFEKSKDAQRALVIINHATSSVNWTHQGLPADTTYVQQWPVAGQGLQHVTNGQGQLQLSVPGQSLVVLVKP